MGAATTAPDTQPEAQVVRAPKCPHCQGTTFEGFHLVAAVRGCDYSMHTLDRAQYVQHDHLPVVAAPITGRTPMTRSQASHATSGT